MAVAALLMGASLRTADFEAILDEAAEGDFAYLDPPYVPLTSTANFTQYTAASFGEDDQRRLASAVHRAVQRGCSVLVSNSDTPLVRALYGRYKVHELRANRNINSDGTRRQKITELAIQAWPD
jgi:DNA adenine methylase